ncbi:MAG: glycosyltransferase [Cyanophyceae cyanobacterium]
MKIAIISSGFLPVVDGVSVTLYNRLQKLSQYGHQVLLFCPDYRSLSHIYPNWQAFTGHLFPGVQVVSLESTASIGLDFERDVTVKSYRTVLAELDKFQPEIIHVDEPERLATRFLKIPGVDYAKRTGIPCVSFFHTNYIEYLDDYFDLPWGAIAPLKSCLKFLFARIYNAYDATLVATRVTQRKLLQIGIKNSVCADLLGVDIEQYQPHLRHKQFFLKKYGLDVEQQVKLISIGRLTPDKGWLFTLDALTQSAQHRHNVTLIIAGDGPLRPQIAGTLAHTSLDVHLLGRISPEEIPALLINSDIYITTSEKETTGLTVLEAMAAGIPVIAPRAGGVVHHVRDGKSGLLYTPQNGKDFTEKLKFLVDNYLARQSLGAKGREFVANYSWDKVVTNLLEIWEEYIKKYSSLRGDDET